MSRCPDPRCQLLDELEKDLGIIVYEPGTFLANLTPEQPYQVYSPDQLRRMIVGHSLPEPGGWV